MKNLVLAALAALALAALPTGAMADTACTVTVTKFHQSYHSQQAWRRRACEQWLRVHDIRRRNLRQRVGLRRRRRGRRALPLGQRASRPLQEQMGSR